MSWAPCGHSLTTQMSYRCRKEGGPEGSSPSRPENTPGLIQAPETPLRMCPHSPEEEPERLAQGHRASTVIVGTRPRRPEPGRREREHRARGPGLEGGGAPGRQLPWPRLGRCWPKAPREYWRGCSLPNGSPRAGPGGREDGQSAPHPPASHPLWAHSTPATAKPQPSGKKMDGQYNGTPRRSVTAQEALTAPGGLQPSPPGS